MTAPMKENNAINNRLIILFKSNLIVLYAVKVNVHFKIIIIIKDIK